MISAIQFALVYLEGMETQCLYKRIIDFSVTQSDVIYSLNPLLGVQSDVFSG